MKDFNQRPLMNGVTGPDKTTATERKRRPMSDEETESHRAESYKLQCEAMRQDRLKAYEEVKELKAQNKVLLRALHNTLNALRHFVPEECHLAESGCTCSSRETHDTNQFIWEMSELIIKEGKAKSLESENK